MNHLLSESLINLHQFKMGIVVTLPLLLYFFLNRDKSQKIEAIMACIFFVSHFFSGMFSGFLFYWIQFFLIVASTDFKSTSDSRSFRLEVVRCLSSGVCFLLGLVASNRLGQISWNLESVATHTVSPNLALGSVLLGVMIQIFRYRGNNREVPLFRECLLIFYSFQILLVFFDDFAQFSWMKVVIGLSCSFTIFGLIWIELRRSTLFQTSLWFPISASTIFFFFMLKEKFQVELFVFGWFLLCTFEFLFASVVTDPRTKRWIQMTLRAGFALGLFGFNRSLLLGLSEPLESSLFLKIIFHIHFFVLQVFSFLWVLRSMKGTTEEKPKAVLDINGSFSLVLLILMNPLFLIGQFPISPEFSLGFSHSIFKVGVDLVFREQDTEVMTLQIGVLLSAIVVSFFWAKLSRPHDIQDHLAMNRRNSGSLLRIESFLLNLVARSRIPVFGFPRFLWVRENFAKWRTQKNSLELQIGLATVFGIFLWFIFGVGRV
jgi:hypothetical protein